MDIMLFRNFRHI
ncbi:hypothetical protein Zm00014a_015695 [Zea mays]|uniref:Uncharacterized protein n=1 Tax=Zea mays TaxID=4577 RepID=A0A317YJE5_MAIZE|nr:hypothetical protein Zm00014a_029297 [Zea mays]PWZ25237.1 hypothetical protein Zm00014a_030560 [Zea mays]PWZ26993.1 hypothetical protein Zm00014a_003875 [Zea mays]PWZ28052.1 hypothetical protein Zm00014a_043016 [Zea mays]PWZ33848.1 hypothetical protein Zm00014a_017731 [Zea mays]